MTSLKSVIIRKFLSRGFYYLSFINASKKREEMVLINPSTSQNHHYFVNKEDENSILFLIHFGLDNGEYYSSLSPWPPRNK